MRFVLKAAKRPAGWPPFDGLGPFRHPPGWGSVQRRGKYWVAVWTEDGKRHTERGAGDPFETRAEAEWALSFMFGLVVAERMSAIDREWYQRTLADEKRRRQAKRRQAARKGKKS